MKKQYIVPTVLGHKIITPTLLAGSPVKASMRSGGGNSKIQENVTAHSKSSFSFEDDEPAQSASKEHDFAYGL